MCSAVEEKNVAVRWPEPFLFTYSKFDNDIKCFISYRRQSNLILTT